MYKLSFAKRVWIVKQYKKGVSSSKIALSQRISPRTVQSLVKNFNIYGWDALKDHKTGRPEIILNKNAEIIILDLRERYKYGACRIEQILKKKGFSISHRQIEKLIVRNGLVEPNIKKQKPRKWVRYELPNPNDMWHTDWTYDPFTTWNFSVYIDDRTRLITSYGIFKRATAENSISLLKTGIDFFGKPKSIMTDHGSSYYANYPGSKQENTQFRQALNTLGIKHYLARVNRPQTNGKVERFFLTYKTEYANGSFKSIKDFIKHYNTERPHMSLNYKTPKEAWDDYKKAK
jgi:putative transposase